MISYFGSSNPTANMIETTSKIQTSYLFILIIYKKKKSGDLKYLEALNKK